MSGRISNNAKNHPGLLLKVKQVLERNHLPLEYADDIVGCSVPDDPLADRDNFCAIVAGDRAISRFIMKADYHNLRNVKNWGRAAMEIQTLMKGDWSRRHFERVRFD
jgi:hypothetical protein